MAVAAHRGCSAAAHSTLIIIIVGKPSSDSISLPEIFSESCSRTPRFIPAGRVRASPFFFFFYVCRAQQVWPARLNPDEGTAANGAPVARQPTRVRADTQPLARRKIIRRILRNSEFWTQYADGRGNLADSRNETRRRHCVAGQGGGEKTSVRLAPETDIGRYREQTT